MSRVLLTGSSGFIGRAVAQRLSAAGHEVLGVDPVRDPHSVVSQVLDDLASAERLQGILATFRPTHVMHTGGISGPMVIPDQPARIMDINVTGSLNLLQAALACGAGVFVYCSSVSAVGDFYEQAPIDDDYPLRPASPYGASKAALEMVLRGLWGRLPLDVCALRFTAVYGPGRQTTQVIHEFIAAAREGRAITVQDATAAPYVYIDDAADAAVAACFSTTRKRLAYFVAHPEQVSLPDIAAAVQAELGPVAWKIDGTLPKIRRGPMNLKPAEREFGFVAQVGHREGIRRIVAAG